MGKEAVLTIRKNFYRPDPDLVKLFPRLPTGYLADVQGRRGAPDCGIWPLFDVEPFAGTAVTVKTVPNDNLAPYAALDLLKAGDVMLIATEDWTGSAVIGDLIVGMFKNAGVLGVVTDGAVRDLTGLIKVGLPVYARGTTANSPQKNGPGSVGLPITIGGVIVHSGDLVVADRDGVVVLPRQQIPEAARKIEAIRDKETKIEMEIAKGMIMPDWVKEVLSSGQVQYVDQEKNNGKGN
ncbi:MAG: RraA family protein [Deltaproteobacteria bacterium]|nr:RraA family protein [Deltaproteobacteria bacterium]MBW2153855.1 RraA family protein [Deltaproteobacteria bacterium]